MSRIISAKSVGNCVRVTFERKNLNKKKTFTTFFHRWWLADNCDFSTRFDGNAQKHTNAPDRDVEAYVFVFSHKIRGLFLSS